jgi:hypothetical protein
MTRRCPGFDVDAQASRFIEIFLVIVPGVRKVLNREGWGNRFVCSSGRDQCCSSATAAVRVLLFQRSQGDFLTDYVSEGGQIGGDSSGVQREPGLFRGEEILNRIVVHHGQVNGDVHISI